MIHVRRPAVLLLPLLLVATLCGGALAQGYPYPRDPHREPYPGDPRRDPRDDPRRDPRYDPPPSRAYYDTGVAWRKGQGCWSWGGPRAGWGEAVDELACKYCGDGRMSLPSRGPMWRGSQCFNRFNGWKELLPDSACRYSRNDGGCAYLGSYDEDSPFEGIGYDPYPGSGAAIRKGGGCWNYHRGWKELLEDAACRYCGGNSWAGNAGPQLRKGQGCWNWDGRGWDGRLDELACKYHGCAGSGGQASAGMSPVLERASSAAGFGDESLRGFIRRAEAAPVPAVE